MTTKSSLRDALRVYRGGASPAQPPPVIPGRVAPPAPARDTRRALTVAAALLLPALLVGVVVYAARTVRVAPVAVPPATPAVEAAPVVVERVVEVPAAPVVIIVTATPQAVVQPAQPAQAARPARSLPLPTATPPPAAWPAPQPVTQAYGCVGLGPCNPPSPPAKQFAGYQCPDGRFFDANGPWGMFGFGTWVVEGQGDVVNIRDTSDPDRATMGWHNNCSKVWR